MNQVLRLSTLSADRAQQKNKNEKRSSFDTTRKLSNFLVRRRLLTIESESIQSSLAEIEAEIKAGQERLVALRDRVLASLRQHLAGRETALREELALRERFERRGNLKSLPKTAERYIRLKGKQILAYLKPASAAVAETSDAVCALDRGWHLPKAAQLNAWADWFAEGHFSLSKDSRFRKDRIQVALVVSGGLGDLLKSTHLARAISDHFSCDLTIIAAQRAVGEVVAHNPYVRDSFVPVSQHALVFSDIIRDLSILDLIIEWTYSVKYIIPPRSRIARED